MISYVARWHLGARDRKDVVVTLPLKTVSESNMREHWAPKAKRAKKARQLAAWGCGGPLAEYRTALAKGYVATLSVMLTRISPRPLDDDNLRGALKAVRDGITDALGLADDRDARLRWDYGQERGKVGEYAVQITVSGEP